MGREWHGDSHGFGHRKHRKGEQGRRRSGASARSRVYRATHGPAPSFLDLFGHKTVIIGVALIALVLFGVGVSGGPLFHSLQANPNYHTIDPIQSLWVEHFPNNDLNAWNTGVFGQSSVTFCAAPCNGLTGLKGIRLTSTASFPAIAITKSPISDLSPVSAKELWTSMEWIVNSVPSNAVFGWFLTRNSTVPNTGSWTPESDISVSYYSRNRNISPWEEVVFLQNDPSTSVDTGALACGGAVFLCGSLNIGSSASQVTVRDTTILNFTSGADTGNNKVSLAQEQVINGCVTTCLHVSTSQQLPWFRFQGEKYYLGVWAGITGGVTDVDFVTDANQATPCAETGFVLCYYVPTASNPTPPLPSIDTGGFFGPVIKALISIGVFIGQNIITFVTFLFNILGPLISGAINALASVIISIINAIGGLFGDNQLGTQIGAFVADFASFISGSFRNMTGLVNSIVVMINNIVTFISNFLGFTAFTSLLFGNGSFLAALLNLWTVINGVFGDLAKWFVAGSFSAIAILQVDWIFGTIWTALDGTDGWTSWLNINTLIIVSLFKIAYWLFELGLDIVFKIVLIIKGRVSPIEVMGSG